MKRLKLWLSSVFYGMCKPYIDQRVRERVEFELSWQKRLTKDIKAYIEEDLNHRIPHEGTTHALACHVRDHAREIDKRLQHLEQQMFDPLRRG